MGKVIKHITTGIIVMFGVLIAYSCTVAPSTREKAMSEPCVQALYSHYERHGTDEKQVIAGYAIAKEYGLDADSPDKTTRYGADRCVLYAKAFYTNQPLPLVGEERLVRCGMMMSRQCRLPF